MDFSDWLDAEPGRLTATARHFDLTLAAVCQWRTNGVPTSRMLAVRDFSRGKVTLEAMLKFRDARRAVA